EKQREEVRILGERRVGLEERLAGTGQTREEAHRVLSEPLAHLMDWRARVERERLSFVDELARQVTQWRENQAAVEAAEQALNQLATRMAEERGREETQSTEVTGAQQQLEVARSELDELYEERNGLFDGRAADEVEQTLALALENAGKALEAARGAVRETSEKMAGLSAGLGKGKQNLARLEQRHGELKELLERELLTLEMDWKRMKALFAIGDEELRKMAAEIRNLERQQAANRALIEERGTRLEAHEQERPALEEEKVSLILEEQQERLRTIRGTARDLALQLQRDRENRSRSGELMERLQRQQETWRAWAALSGLIGSSDGKRFRSFAQSLTLEALVAHANQHLEQLSRRYRLQRVPGAEMELQIVDADLGNEVRNIYGLSGGETFLVSLALALGMASLSAHRVQVESLFIDEGFGTLDADTLDMAIEALDALQAQGRQVGIISHVPALVEGVRVQVRVQQHGGGRSGTRLKGAINVRDGQT
ncbi:MAG TPA: hypothetical protein EYP90_00155, partial [Chromatiaceae bacterium]|nr:hypothetical protein [Chromatiaceae bacterium]